jgi:hypothetical protein
VKLWKRRRRRWRRRRRRRRRSWRRRRNRRTRERIKSAADKTISPILRLYFANWPKRTIIEKNISKKLNL